MEPPISFQADAVRDEQSKVLHAITPISPEDVLTRAVRGPVWAKEWSDPSMFRGTATSLLWIRIPTPKHSSR